MPPSSTTASSREVITMSMQSENKSHGLLNNLPAQLALLAVAAVVLIAIAWKYVF
jgi:hypothetical protein